MIVFSHCNLCGFQNCTWSLLIKLSEIFNSRFRVYSTPNQTSATAQIVKHIIQPASAWPIPVFYFVFFGVGADHSQCSTFMYIPVAELVLVLSDPVFSSEQCSPGSAQKGVTLSAADWAATGVWESPRFFLTFASLIRYLAIALTYWLNF